MDGAYRRTTSIRAGSDQFVIEQNGNCAVKRVAICTAIALMPGLVPPAGAERTDPLQAVPDAEPDSSRLQIPSSFQTKYASFEPAGFDELPGWERDRTSEAWGAFQRSCAVLQSRPAWHAPCARMRQVPLRDDVAIRAFFEQQFTLYRILDTDRAAEGIVTGYYEPLLYGSRQRSEPYVHPVYGLPADMLYLDARRLPAIRAAGMKVRIVPPTVLPASVQENLDEPTYVLELSGAQPDIRTKRYRLRTEGNRVVPYFSRQEIEQGQLRHAEVLVWVDDAAALYSMQMQGSGKIRLPNGEQIRLSYAEQNGHPFLPPLLAYGQRSDARHKIPGRPRQSMDNNAEAARESADAIQEEAPVRTRGLRRQGDGQHSDAAVNDVIESLLRSGSAGAADTGYTPTRRRPAHSASEAAPAEPASGQRRRLPVQAKPQTAGAEKHSPRLQGPSVLPGNDPSYVFFRVMPDNGDGPIGALGVALTPGRSVAVDPRTTPLGFPVFISTVQQVGEGAFSRLMLAQDTGGAIRGAIRADYFWGFGSQAYLRASRMKAEGRMWVFLPKGQEVNAASGISAMRGIGSGNNESPAAECMVPDPEFCIE